MRIEKLWLDGYGRFTDTEVELQPGFQVILGPNEQGKSTLRNFIGDMLYGQKRSTTQRSYEESYEMRRPWHRPEPYGGRLRYTLDNGHCIEVQRVFDRRQEGIQVFDRTDAKEITGSFEVLRNRENTFAEQHLGLSKQVFLSTATITHFTLENLGDAYALSQIREKILSLADTSEEHSTAEGALAYLNERMGAIGRPTARTRLLPTARAAMEELERELVACQTLRRELAEQEARRVDLRERCAYREERLQQAKAELAALEHAEKERRLEEAEHCQDELDVATQTCFSLSAVRDFKVEQEHELQRLINVLNTARTQVTRTERDLHEVHSQLDEEREKLGPAGVRNIIEVPAETEERLEQLEQEGARKSERLDQLQVERRQAEQRLEEAERDLEALPDFSKLESDPMEWLGRLSANFTLQREGRDRAREHFKTLAAEVTELEVRVEKPTRIFEEFEDFPGQAEEYKVATRLREERWEESLSQVERLRATLRERESGGPRFGIYTALAFLVAGGLGLAGYSLEIWLLFISGGFFVVVGAFLAVALAGTQASISQARQALRVAEERLDELEESGVEDRQIRDAVRESGYDSLRELEALHEQYQRDRERLQRLYAEKEAAQAVMEGEEERVSRLLERTRTKLAMVNVELSGEDDVDRAATAGMARYQEYRDAKRRVNENRGLPGQLQTQIDQTQEELEALQAKERDLALQVRQTMREEGFRDEAKHTSALKAVRAYGALCSQLREKRGRVDMLEEQAAGLQRQLDLETGDLEAAQEGVQRFLRVAGVDSIQAWHDHANQAREYRAAWERRNQLQEKLETMLQGRSVEVLRTEIRAYAGGPPPPERPRASIETEIASLQEEISELREAGHALQVEVAQRAGNARPLSEIEEALVSAQWRCNALQLEMDAANHAYTIIEDVASDRHARIAPQLASHASKYLGEITDGRYSELLVSRDLRVTIRNPQTRQLNDNPERRLSKGTVDQIYLALRLALVEGLSRTGESVPMLLDDPFANYDDSRQRQALELLQRLADTYQFILFTCHEDVANQAQEAGATLLRI